MADFRNQTAPWIAGILLVLGLAVWWLTRAQCDWSYSAGSLALQCPTFAARADNGDWCVVDSARRRVLRLDAAGNLRFLISGGSRDNQAFFYAFQAIPGPDGSTLVLNSVPDDRGMYHVREEIQQYDEQGRYLATLYRMEYPNATGDHTLLRHGRLRGMTCDGGVIRWFECLPEGLAARRIVWPQRKRMTTALFDVPDANWHVAGAAALDDTTAVYTHKDGRIYRISGELGSLPEVIYAPESAAAPQSKPWEIATDAAGRIYFADMARRAICRLDADGAVTPVLEGDKSVFYSVAVGADGTVATCDELGVRSPGAAELTAVTVPWRLAGLMWVGLAALTVAAAAGAYLLWRVYLRVTGRTMPRVLLLFLGLVVVMGVAAYIVGSGLIRDFSQRNQMRTIQHIEQLIRTVSAGLDGELIARLNRAGDYMNADYRRLREHMDAMFPIDDPDGEGFYYVLSRVVDGQFYGMIWQEASIGLFHPFNFYDPEFPDPSFREAQAGAIRISTVEDVTGSWLFGVGPVYNQAGEVVALLEVGTDNFVFAARNRELLQKTILETATALIVIALLLLEVLYFSDLVRRRREVAAGVGVADFSPTYFARPLVFLYFTASSMPLAFIPLMMKSFYAPVPYLSEEMVLALPISVNMLCFGIANLAAGYWTGPRHYRRVIYCGLLLSAVGFLASGLATGMIGFTLARGLVGIGNGFAFIGIRSVMLMEKDPALKDTGYAHFYAGMTAGINVGLFAGALIADSWSFQTAFFVSTILIGAVMWFEVRFLHTIFAELARQAGAAARNGAARVKGSFRQFITDGHAVAFILLDIIPCYTIAAFIFFFFPLFAEAHGASTSDIGRWMLFSGVLTILFGPALTRFISQTLGTRRGMYFAFTVWSASILVFVVTGSWIGAILTILAMGLADGFATPFCNNYFLTLKAAQRVGEERAVSYFELAGKAGDTLGPVIFAFALGFGQTRGVALIGIACLVFVILLYGVDRWYQRREKREADC